MFQIPVIEVPTNLPNIRKDLPIQAFAVRCLSYLSKFGEVLGKGICNKFLISIFHAFYCYAFRLHEENGSMFVKKLSLCSDWVVRF